MNILHDGMNAEECTNDTWLQAWSSIPPQVPVKLKFYLAKITRNLSFNKYKSLSAAKRGQGMTSYVLEELDEILPSSTDVESVFMKKELERTMNLFLHTLSQRDCNVFIRRYFFNEGVKEISARYDLSENHVLVSLSRTRQKLRKHLQKEGFLIE